MNKRKGKTKKVTRQGSRTRTRKNESAEYSLFTKIILAIIIIATSIFVLLANMGKCGIVGTFIKAIFVGGFGTIGYLSPILILLTLIICLTNNVRMANFKIYALLIFYLMITCAITCTYYDILNTTDLENAIENIGLNSMDVFSFESLKFGGGAIGVSISYFASRLLGNAGARTFFITISVISFLCIFGFGISKIILRALQAIIMFIPNMIRNAKENYEENMQIAIDNENILKETIAKNKNAKKNESIDLDYDFELPSNSSKKDEVVTKNTFDTRGLTINPMDIQSRFFKAEVVDAEEKEKKDELLNELKKKSINEIMSENKDMTANSFFYSEGMKPIEELSIKSAFEPKVSFNTIPDESSQGYEKTYIDRDNENNIYENETNQNDDREINDNENTDINSFAHGIDDLRDSSATFDIDNATSKEVVNTNKDIELVAKTREDMDMVTRVARQKKFKKYKYPLLNFLKRSENKVNAIDESLKEKAEVLVETLRQFNVEVDVTNITVGPSVTRFELKPHIGVKISKILALEDDVKLALAATEIRIEAPIPGKSAIGIEIPNKESSGVLLGDIINSHEFKNAESKLTVAIGKDISGKTIVADLRKMPHVLIAGATGSGKSVCINSIITSLIYKSEPADVRLIMVDPKVVELQVYDGIPHLLIPVVTDPKKAAQALNWAVKEMTRRYNLIQEKRVRDIESYNQAISGEIDRINVNDDNEADLVPVSKLPYIVIIIDEFADLMMVASKDVENSIMRIAQLARACGIYLVIATQRPSVNVISGSIKTNVPSRISFAVSSGIDSQTVLDRRGAEKLLGHGDMLYFPQGIPEPVRVQGCYVSEEEIIKVVDYIKDSGVSYNIDAEEAIQNSSASNGSGYNQDEKDEMFYEAGRLVINEQQASIGLLQRRFRMGFNRAARIIDELEADGIVSRQDGKKPREVTMDIEEFENKYKGK